MLDFAHETPNIRKTPPPCADVVVEVLASHTTVVRALDAVTAKQLVVHRENDKARILVPEFPVMACVVIE
ncbi:MAG: hypothetical protein H8E44_21630 [Planctomycetes bacterium]|nr:hypothetical protein [Planctomycetota bacterium]MBL7043805.1 hypothetical protein [Pirellulaceae bacterium]